MRGLLIGVALLSSIGLGGCATQAQREATSIRLGADAAGAARKACFAQAAANPQYASLDRHVPLAGDQPPTLEQKADQTLATPQETKLVLAWRSDVGQCRKAYLEAVQGFAPALVPVFLDAFNTQDAVWIKVVHREVAWGQAVQQLGEIQASAQAKIADVDKEMTASLERQNQVENAQRAQAMAAVGGALQNAADNMQRQQMINAISRPITTNCSAFGNSASCTTY
jgi:hypothetical protein